MRHLLLSFLSIFQLLDSAAEPSAYSAVDATYRADLREVNELNFSRFDAKMGQRLAELKTDLLKWMFGFWVSALLGLGALFFRK